MIIIPSILTNDPQELREMLDRCDEVFDRVQIDIVDGKFVDNKTIDPVELKYIDINLKLDFHLMTKEPTAWVERCASAGAERIIGQIEMMGSQQEFIKKVQGVGAEVGLALDINTPVEQIDEVLLYDLDVVLLMSYPAGFGGQKFRSEVLNKIKKLDKMRQSDSTPFQICIDGGVDKDNISKVALGGVDEIVIGKRLLSGDIHKNLKVLYEYSDTLG